MPAYKNIALAGAGTLGSFILSALAEKNVSVKVLSRKESPNKPTLPSNAQLIPVDYTSAKDLENALQGVEVIISTLTSFGIFDQQESLARAAKVAGVQLFIPSEFGNPTDRVRTGLVSGKSKLHDILDEIALPYTLVFTGIWPELVVIRPQPSKALGFEFPSKVTIWGQGKQPISWTSRASIATFLAAVLTTSSIPTLPQIVRLEGSRASLRDIVVLYEKVNGVKVEIEEHSVSELDERLAKNSKDAPAYLLKESEEGRGDVGEPNGKELWPEWEPEKFEDILKNH